MIPNTRELILRNLRHVRGTLPLDGFIFSTTYKSSLDASAKYFAHLTRVEGVPFWEVQLRSTTTSEVRAVVTYMPLAHNGLSYWHCTLCGIGPKPCPHVSFVAKDVLGRTDISGHAPDIDGMTWGVDHPYAHKRYSWQNFEWVFVIRDVSGSLWRLHARNKISGERLVFSRDVFGNNQDGLDGLRQLFAAAYRRQAGRNRPNEWNISRVPTALDTTFEGLWSTPG